MAEIERKFRVGDVPGLDAVEGTAIEQGYLAIDREVEVRLRRAGEAHRLTTKRGHGAEREEVEIEIAADDFERLWPLSAGRRVAKTRHRIDLGNDLTAEVDVYAGELAGLRVVEVEFPDAAAARRFEPPEWFGEELTGDERYANQTLATGGLPAGEPGADAAATRKATAKQEHEGPVAAREWDAAR
jgi:adenylate cyclase